VNTGILKSIELLGEANQGKSDLETQKLIKQIISAIENKKRQEWPTKDLRANYNLMDKLQKKLFLATMKDMDAAITEAYGNV
jgi:hypothetical protein